MKRELKFRAWGIWDDDFTSESPKMNYDLAFEEYAPINILLSSVKHLMQYTGFKDKNGKDIYEGDILSTWYSRDMTDKDIIKSNFVVEWEENVESSGWNIPFLENAEVIGNIYENKDLI